MRLQLLRMLTFLLFVILVHKEIM